MRKKKREEEEEWQHAEERTLSVEGTAGGDVCLFASPILRTNQRWRPTKEYHSASRRSLTLRNVVDRSWWKRRGIVVVVVVVVVAVVAIVAAVVVVVVAAAAAAAIVVVVEEYEG
ncbi:hypothetical protein V1478_014691 [Vespula squamosa]|uniref:Uncharacterized protein n=1 Tax=Vespula squamosa TaxID=30214 RepID=A0ABD2A2Y5_VESSQ